MAKVTVYAEKILILNDKKFKGRKRTHLKYNSIRDSIVVSIPACHAGDRGSIPRLGVIFGKIYCALK